MSALRKLGRITVMIEECPICRQKNSKFLAWAVIAPWIRDLTGKSTPSITRLMKCIWCKVIYFDYRFKQSELQAIYRNYRDNDYFEKRNRYEPWYTTKENNLYFPDSKTNAIHSRKQNMKRHMEKSGVNLKPNISALDFGGDQGQFFPKEASRKFLFEYSEKRPNDLAAETSSGIIKVSNLDSLETQQDLVMLCGVLEHLTYPMVELGVIKKVLAGNQGILYIEVPLDAPRVSCFHKTKLYKKYLLFISIKLKDYPIFFICADLISGIFRNLKFRIPFFGIVKQSEHINYFTAESLKSLLEKDFEVLSVFEDSSKMHGKFRLGELVAICKSKQSF